MSEQNDTTKQSNKTKRIAIGSCFLIVGAILTLSFFSFFFTWENDQSELLNKSAGEFLFSQTDTSDPALEEAQPIEILNKGGKLGALLSKKFIHDWFGIGSFAIVFLCFFFMLRFFDFAFMKKLNVKRYVFVAISMMLVLSITFGFFCNDLFDGNIGGYIGYHISYQLLRSVLGTFVTGLLIIVVDALYTIFTFKKVLPFFQQKIADLRNRKSETIENEEITNNTATIENEQPEEQQQVENPVETVAEQPMPTQPTPQIVDVQPVETVIEEEIPQTQKETEEPVEESTDVSNTEPNTSEDSEEPPLQDDESSNTEEEPVDTEDDEDIVLDPNNEEDDTEDTPTDEESETQEENVPEAETPIIPPQPVTPPHIPDGKMQIINTVTAVEDTSHIEMEMQDYDPKADLSHFKQPGIDLLKIYPNDEQAVEVDYDEQIRNQNLIEKTLSDFGIEIETIKATVGPTITLYEIVPKAGTKISRIQSLEKDIMMSLSALGIRIIAPIPGKGTVGIEVPNKNRQTVSMYSVINSKAFKESKMELPVALGKTITNDVYMFDLAKMPHLLVAGSTGQGKSVGLNAIVTSLLYKKHPSQLKFVMVDPKMVEFSIYGGLEKHYMAQYPGEENIILTDCMKVITTLNSLVEEMEDRYKLLMNARCRNIIEYNDKFIHRHLLPTQGHKYLPYIVIIIDEYGDFMMQAGKEIETPIARIAQKARAVGMHLILATQQPSVKIVTSVIKANIPGRIAFRTASNTDSMIILGTPGAEGLVGKGDLLVSYAGNALERVQCAFVDTPEVERIVDFIGNQQGYGQPMQLPEVKEKNQDSGYSGGGDSDKGAGELDPLFEDAARTIIEAGTGSTSAIQRKFQVGYNRAGRIMDQLERYKIVGAYNGSKAREITTDLIGLEQILNNLRANGILKGV